jgi:hypothetical protein
MSYGDLNEGTGPGELDSGTDVQATAPRDVKPMGSEPDIGDAREQERWILGAMTMGIRVSQARRCADDEDWGVEHGVFMATSKGSAVRGCVERG